MKNYTFELDNGKNVTVVVISAKSKKEAIEKVKTKYGLPIYAIR